MKTIFDKILLGNLELKNRIIRSATFEAGAAENGKMTSKGAAFLQSKAENQTFREGFVHDMAENKEGERRGFRFHLVQDDPRGIRYLHGKQLGFLNVIIDITTCTE